MKVVIGADPAGFKLKAAIKQDLNIPPGDPRWSIIPTCSAWAVLWWARKWG
jgi:hypothetical protein